MNIKSIGPFHLLLNGMNVHLSQIMVTKVPTTGRDEDSYEQKIHNDRIKDGPQNRHDTTTKQNGI
jgi:hypothetical protein